MRPNKIKQMWRDGKWVTLGWLSVPHGFTAEVMARQGFDALCVDLQHGLSELRDVWPMLQACSPRMLTSDVACMTAGARRQLDGLKAATA